MRVSSIATVGCLVLLVSCGSDSDTQSTQGVEDEPFRIAADEMGLTGEPRVTAGRAYAAFKSNGFTGGVYVVKDGPAEVVYQKPFAGPGNVTPGAIVALSKAVTTSDLGREVGYYRIGNGDGEQFVLALLGTSGGAEPEGVVEAIAHNHPRGEPGFSYPGNSEVPGEDDCSLFWRTGQSQSVLAYGYSSGAPEGVNGTYDIKDIATSCPEH